MGKTKKLLGANFDRSNKENLSIYQTDYIIDTYNKFSNYNIPCSSLPISKGTHLSKSQGPDTEEEKEQMRKLPYRNLIGCLAFLAQRTRPDICFAVNRLSQFQESPGDYHWHHLKRLLGYVYQTRDQQLKLSEVRSLNLNCYSDADFAADPDNRISVGGIVLMVDEIPIIWRTYKHKFVSLSTMESEFTTLTEAAKELLWLCSVLKF
ncbi:gag pol protein [Lasius niger]|uniref:Gag pol protein n=1 Tax=Lasius niger TaxID=67767 RepID=A0A0J7MP79_LASNI|nr:gag pol protein [Lasius niger]